MTRAVANSFRVESHTKLFDVTPYPSVHPRFTDYDVYPTGCNS